MLAWEEEDENGKVFFGNNIQSKYYDLEYSFASIKDVREHDDIRSWLKPKDWINNFD